MSKLENKIAIITGGNSGIGYASAKKFKEEGAMVIITGRNKEATGRAAEKLGVTAVVSDQANLSDIDKLVKQIKDEFSGADILVISAGVASYFMIEDIPEKNFDDMMNVNFKGALFTLQKFIPILREGASVINVSSINAYSGMPLTCAYAASKAALNSLTRTAAYELTSKKIRVNAVNPGATNTPVWGKVGLSEEALADVAAAMQERIPMKRFGEPDEIAKLIAFLASEDASFITGAEYTIDGGTIVNPILG